MKTVIRKRIEETLNKAGRAGIRQGELARRVRLKPAQKRLFGEILQEMRREGTLSERKGRLTAAGAFGLVAAEIVRVNKTFGFAQVADGDDVFIPGRLLKGSMPGDTVQLRLSRESRGSKREGEVVRVVKYGPGEFTGKIVLDDGKLCVLPDSFTNFPLTLSGPQDQLRPGQKVAAQVVKRGERHSGHRAKITQIYGDSTRAADCCTAILGLHGISPEFPLEVEDEAAHAARRGVTEADCRSRLDLREEDIFTIDGADSMDLDDAVSLKKTADGYELGVHIADVSHYVRFGSPLDREAFERGTSIYFADQVVPMLPKTISNGICSLHPDDDRLTVSALMTLDETGHLKSYDVQKSVIRSRVKGVYSEVNAVMDGTADAATKEKYGFCTGTLHDMERLTDLRIALRKERGAPEIETTESKILLGKDGTVDEIVPRERGKAERMIEEFMLLANEAVARLAMEDELPFVYRVHEKPVGEKVETLKAVLELLHLSTKGIENGVSAQRLNEVIEQARGTEHFGVVNNQVLRSMAKAKYSEYPTGHYGLCLEHYAHFTSPIRRYPDLMVHRMLSGYLAEGAASVNNKRNRKAVHEAALQATATELVAVQVERECEDCYKAEYMTKHVGEVFTGVISGVISTGFYVELPNTVEGMVRTDSLPGIYTYDGYFQLKSESDGPDYQFGQTVEVQCVAADVNSGNIDFVCVSTDK